ncbi:NDUFB10 domain containing protein [Trichuris trichiura]|uniref:NADH dehydrogenase [ubiquinone] 1 beta subcomplex subunit 10 n=1 Tax=Trichuris trichiura TaxID=36087 RepID=A0A077ZIK6_TRITR|nr:NDUFB10 domain containing protein [Trichuris trichiura]
MEVESETLAERRKREDKEASKAFWDVLEIDSRGYFCRRFTFYAWRFLDIPATWFREKIVEPLQKDRKLAFYHQKFNRVPTIDECPVTDRVCYEEAQWQYHMDKMVDGFILDILRNRMRNCRVYYGNEDYKCAKCFDEFEEAELNYYIKYGEIGARGDVLTAYMKQKHRMVWERRHPEIMEARAAARTEHKKQLEQGYYDPSFWKRNDARLFKNYTISLFAPMDFGGVFRGKRDNLSQDPEYYKRREEAKAKGEWKEQPNPFSVWP